MYYEKPGIMEEDSRSNKVFSSKMAIACTDTKRIWTCSYCLIKISFNILLKWVKFIKLIDSFR